MINIKCQECDHDYPVYTVNQFGIGDIIINIEPCPRCLEIAEENAKVGDELYEEIDELRADIEHLEGSNKELNEMINFIWAESREHQYKELFEKAQAREVEAKRQVGIIEQECQEKIDKANAQAKGYYKAMEKTQARSKEIRDECDVELTELKFKIKKLTLELNKEKSRNDNGGKYKRTVDL